MHRADTLEQDVHALKRWLDAAWRQLADPNLTRLARRELRNQMKQNDAELRLCMQKILERERHRPPEPTPRTFPKPDLRILLCDPGPLARDSLDLGSPLSGSLGGSPDCEPSIA